MDKNQIVEFNLNRFDSYIERADNKASFLLALVIAILGGSMFQYEKIFTIKNLEWKGVTICILVCFIISLLSSIILCIFTLIPRTPSSGPGNFSIFYFKDVQATNTFLNTLENKSPGEIDDDFKKQTSIVAKVCTQKMNNIKWACITLITGLSLGVILVYLIYFLG